MNQHPIQPEALEFLGHKDSFYSNFLCPTGMSLIIYRKYSCNAQYLLKIMILLSVEL